LSVPGWTINEFPAIANTRKLAVIVGQPQIRL
jgi:hypothetical protein